MTQNNLKIAITGGIGSGKSTVAKIIANQGFTVLSCDEIYKTLLKNKNYISTISGSFKDVITDNGELDRKKLSSIVFSDPQKLKELNDITHPAIICEALKRMSGNGIIFCEVPLLFEGGFESSFDNAIVVLRDKNARIEALKARDKLSVNEIKNRINCQFDYDNCNFEKYYVIHNNSNLEDLHLKTLNVLAKIKKYE